MLQVCIFFNVNICIRRNDSFWSLTEHMQLKDRLNRKNWVYFAYLLPEKLVFLLQGSFAALQFFNVEVFAGVIALHSQ